VHLAHQALLGERLDVTAHGHVRDAEDVHEVADPHTPGPAEVLEDQRLPLPREHDHPPSSRMTATSPAASSSFPVTALPVNRSTPFVEIVAVPAV
jgi:hypothetical protein